jgi:hypothetical protein
MKAEAQPPREARHRPGWARLRAWLTWPDRAPGAAIAAVGSVFLALYAASLVLLPKPDGRIVVGDAVQYYVYLRSAVFDRDLDFRNEYLRFYGERPRESGWQMYDRTATGRAPNFMSIGPAIIWAPAFLLTTGGVAAADALGARYPLDGYGRLFQATAGTSGVVAATIGAWLSFLWARRLAGGRAAIRATLAVWLGSSTLYYSLISPTYSHAPSMLTAALFFFAWGSTLGRRTVGRYVLVGALGGLTALVRWQDVIFLAAPAIEAGSWVFAPAAMGPSAGADDGASLGRRALRAGSRLAACLATAVVVFLPQMFAWRAIYGTPFLVPQGGGFMRWVSPALLEVLFSDRHGLISWTPLVALAVIGLVPLVRANRLVGTVAVVVLGAEWYANAAAADWWAGEAFGARRFVSGFPLFVAGLAMLMPAGTERAPSRLRAAVPALAGLLVVLNLLLLVQYQAFLKGVRDIVPYPEGFYGLWAARFVTPFRLAARLWRLL